MFAVGVLASGQHTGSGVPRGAGTAGAARGGVDVRAVPGDGEDLREGALARPNAVFRLPGSASDTAASLLVAAPPETAGEDTCEEEPPRAVSGHVRERTRSLGVGRHPESTVADTASTFAAKACEEMPPPVTEVKLPPA